MREASQQTNARRDPRHPRGPGRVAHWLPVVLVVAMLAGGLAAYRFEVGPKHLPWLAADPVTEPTAVPPPAGLELPEWVEPTPVVHDAEGAELIGRRLQRALRRPLADDALGRRISVAVGDLAGAGPDWTSGAAAFIPASTTKVVTAVAALEALGPDARLATRVVRGSRPREIVLVGGGDPYLASRQLSPDELAVTYPARADVATLAAATAESLGGSGRVRISYDDSLFTGPSDNPEWRPDYVADDIVAPITALMVDGGREPDGFSRYDDPSLAAARAFAEGLRAAGMKVAGPLRRARADEGSEELARVEGAPLAQVVERVLEVSDNEGAEVLARHVGLAVSGEGSFTGASAGLLTTLEALGVDTSGARIHDGSGLSRHNLLPARVLLDVLRVASAPDAGRLRSALTGLPVAGFTGSLAWRFDEAPTQVLGEVRAKTGTLSGVHALAGLATDRTGTPLVFVVAVDRVDVTRSLDAQAAIDGVAAAIASCRCSRVGG